MAAECTISVGFHSGFGTFVNVDTRKRLLDLLLLINSVQPNLRHLRKLSQT